MVLDNVTAEVTKKVKSAIKAKLTEIGAYVDDELPDYIMILVGNKKTKDQMDDDLSLFLGHNTERFTSWLHNVLQKLNAASLFQKEAKPVKEKEKKKEEEKEKAEVVEAPKTAATVSVVEEKKKHKKKKDKSEKKKEKKEKKKKKDKDKEKHAKSQKHKEKDRSKSKSKSPTGEEGAVASTTKEAVVTRPSSSTALLLKTQKPLVAESEMLAGAATKSTSEDPEAVVLTREEEDVPDDVVNLRPNEEDLALGLEEDLPVKRQNRSLAKEIKELSAAIQPSQLLQNIEVKVDSSGAKEVATKPIIDVSEPEVTTTGNVAVAGASSSISGVSVHDRLGAPTSSVPPLSSTKRIINLREESSFPPKPSLVASGEGIGRVVSSAIASAVKSVAVTAPSKGIADGKTAKKLEARVRPLFNSRRADVVVEEVPEEAVAPSRVVSTVGAVLKRSHSPEDPDESEEPLTKRVGVVSKIEVTPRPRRPGSMQANTALILRAVADAHKSVNKPSRKAVDEKEEEKPNKKELFTRSYHERQNQRLSNTSEGKNVKKFAITVPNALLKDNVEMQIGGKTALGEAHFEGIEMEEEYGPEEAMDASIADTKISQDKILSQPKPSATGRVLPMQVDDPAGSTRFIVTLDGLANEAGSTTDLRSRLSGRPVRTPSVDEEEYIEEVEEWEEVEEMEGVTPQGGIGQERVSSAGGTAGGAFAPKWKSKIDATGLVAKKEERCRFWPACKEGAACPYIHPSKLCNTFPNCRFGDKCIYIHPNCKFDGSCAKPNCPYTHAGTRTFAAPVKAKFPAVRTKIKCRYYPKCVDMTCPYMHPKQICRYGKSCQTPSCIFVHPDVTTGALLKWTAPKQSTGNGESLEGSLPTSALAASSSVSTTTPSLASLSKTTSASLTAV